MNDTQSPKRSTGGRPAILSTERIVTAAIEVLDTEGLDALTMRRLGKQVNVAAMSLYRHVPDRAALLTAVVNRLLADAVVELDAGDLWPEALYRFGSSYRRTLLAHPRAVPLLATQPADIQIGLMLMSAVLERFAAVGISRADAITAVQSVGVFVLGHALAQVGSPSGEDDSGAAPSTVDFYDEWFETGLTAMVRGFEYRYTGR